MTKRSLKLTFPEELITEPLIHNLGQQFNVVTNILRAKVENFQGWVVLQLEGGEEDINRGIDWLIEKGVRVEPTTAEIP